MCCCTVLPCSAKGPEAVPVWTSALPVLYSVFSALIGTQSVLFSKTLAVLLRVTAQGENQVRATSKLASAVEQYPHTVALVQAGPTKQQQQYLRPCEQQLASHAGRPRGVIVLPTSGVLAHAYIVLSSDLAAGCRHQRLDCSCVA